MFLVMTLGGSGQASEGSRGDPEGQDRRIRCQGCPGEDLKANAQGRLVTLPREY